ncbi:MAG: MBL fold metallo-hydrolase [Thermoleophilaceae bacterium]
MKRVTDGLWRISSIGPQVINAYVLGDVLVDALTRHSGRRILRALDGHAISAHALTHVHADHQGASKEVSDTLSIPVWCGEGDADAAADPRLIPQRQPDHPMARLYVRMFAGPAVQVGRVLREGDEVAGFAVLETPGHSAGHVSFWRESDRALVAGDVLTTMNTTTLLPRLGEPKPYLTTDIARNRESIRRLAALEPEIVCVGHGPPLRDPRKLTEFASKLPA